MVSEPVTVRTATRALEAVRRMAEHDIGCVVVVEDGAPVGILTERDVLRLDAHGEDEPDDWRTLDVGDVMTAPVYTISDEAPWVRAMDVMGDHGVRHLPVTRASQLVGIVSARDVLRHHTEVLEALVRERTAELQRKNDALARREKERTHDLEVAGRVQRHLLAAPDADVDWVRVFTWTDPRDEVGGDVVEVVSMEDGALRLFLGDVSGHGVQASLITVLVKGSLATPLRHVAHPADLLEGLNRLLDGLLPEQFVTGCALRLERSAQGSCLATIACAGHPAPLRMVGAEPGRVEELRVGGTMLGLLPDPGYTEARLELGSGDRLLVFTDGLTERKGRDGELFGARALRAVLETTRSRDADEVLPILVEAASTFGAESEFEDDTTCILIEVPRTRAPLTLPPT